MLRLGRINKKAYFTLAPQLERMKVRNLGSFTEAYTPIYIHYGTINQQALSTGSGSGSR